MSEVGNFNVLDKSREEAVHVLKEWEDDLKERIVKHRKGGNQLRLLNRILGGLNVVLAAASQLRCSPL